MNQETNYLFYITQQGTTIFVSYDDIQSLMKGQPVVSNDFSGDYFLTVITFKDGVREQQIVSAEQWSIWEEVHNG